MKDRCQCMSSARDGSCAACSKLTAASLCRCGPRSTPGTPASSSPPSSSAAAPLCSYTSGPCALTGAARPKPLRRQERHALGTRMLIRHLCKPTRRAGLPASRVPVGKSGPLEALAAAYPVNLSLRSPDCTPTQHSLPGPGLAMQASPGECSGSTTTRAVY